MCPSRTDRRSSCVKAESIVKRSHAGDVRSSWSILEAEQGAHWLFCRHVSSPPRRTRPQCRLTVSVEHTVLSCLSSGIGLSIFRSFSVWPGCVWPYSSISHACRYSPLSTPSLAISQTVSWVSCFYASSTRSLHWGWGADTISVSETQTRSCDDITFILSK